MSQIIKAHFDGKVAWVSPLGEQKGERFVAGGFCTLIPAMPGRSLERGCHFLGAAFLIRS